MAHSRFGLFHQIALPYAVRFILTILLLDFVRYAVHWAEHHVPILWRMHQVHHSDPDFDLSTGARVHPLETVLVQGATLAAVALLAPPVAAVLAVELVTCFQVFFAHANVSMPVWTGEILTARLCDAADASCPPFGRRRGSRAGILQTSFPGGIACFEPISLRRRREMPAW